MISANIKRITVITKLWALMALLTFPLALPAQSGAGKTEAEQEQELYEAIQKQVENYETSLELEDWQVFYVDSILTHNTMAVSDEFKRMNALRVSNSDIYLNVRDSWEEKTYEAFRKILTEEQWTKYIKLGAGREKKSRDKRKAKNSGL